MNADEAHQQELEQREYESKMRWKRAKEAQNKLDLMREEMKSERLNKATSKAS